LQASESAFDFLNPEFRIIFIRKRVSSETWSKSRPLQIEPAAAKGDAEWRRFASEFSGAGLERQLFCACCCNGSYFTLLLKSLFV
jgi:hypothetical protein